MKENLLVKLKRIIDHLAIIGVFYILLYRISNLRKIGKEVCQYLIDWFFDIDMSVFKDMYFVGERLFRSIILMAIVSSIIMKLVYCSQEYRLKKIEVKNRFDKSLLKYLQDKYLPRVFLLTGQWGSGKTYEINKFFDKYYKYTNANVYRISCFGLSSRKDLINEINNAIEQGDNSVYSTTIKVLQYLPIIGEAINKFLKKSYEYSSLKEDAIFIFDDFERITARPIMVNSSKRLYRQSSTLLSNAYGGRNSFREFNEIKEEFKSVEKGFSQIDDFFSKHSVKLDYEKYIAVIGLINELVETYGCKVIIVCNSDMLGEKFVHDVLRSKLNCIEYKKLITPEVRVSVIDNILKSRMFDDESKQQRINSYIESVKENIELLMLDSRFNDLRLFGGLLEAFIDTAMLFSANELTKEFLNSLLNSILIMHLTYYNNSIEKVEFYANGADIEFLIRLFGGPISVSKLIHINHNSGELKWIDPRISGNWIYNLSMPEDLVEIYESWRTYKYSDIESKMSKNLCGLDEENQYNFMHVLLYQKRQNEDKVEDLERDSYVRRALKEYNLKNKVEVEYVLNIMQRVFLGRYYPNFANTVFEVIKREYGDGPLDENTHYYNEYKRYLEKNGNDECVL